VGVPLQLQKFASPAAAQFELWHYGGEGRRNNLVPMIPGGMNGMPISHT
jgi:hypothetical protein